MNKNVLICTLGETPPVVTEALDLLRAKGVTVNEVILLTTIDSLAQEGVELLRRHINDYYKGPMTFYPVYIESYEDIVNEKAVVEFMIKACGVLKGKIREGANVYVNIAGGRKTMSALMTLAVQFYGAKELFHIIINDKDLEENSYVKRLRHFEKEKMNRIFHPDPSLVIYVRMPFIGLLPWITEILKVLKGGRTEKPEVSAFIKYNNLIENGKLTEMGKLILKILETVESRPTPYFNIPEISIGKHHYKSELEDVARKIAKKIEYLVRITSTDWREGKEKVIKIPPNKLKIFIDIKKETKLGLLLETTATTEGQLEFAAREVEGILHEL